MRRLVASLAAVVVVAAGGGMGGLGSTPAAAQNDAPTPVELNGTGTGMVSGFLNAWAGPLYASSRGTSLTYFAVGSRDGRAAWARGDKDFAITGRPLTDADTAALTARNTTAIEAPIAVSAMVMLMAPTYGSPLRVQYAEGEGDDAVYTQTPWAGPVKMTNDLVARIMLEKSQPLGNEPSFTAQIPQQPATPTNPTPLPVTLVSSNRPVLPVVRSDPGATDYYLEQFIKMSAIDAWNAKSAELRVPPSTLSENWPFLPTPSRSGDDALGQLVGGWFSPDGNTYTQGGTMAPVSPSTAKAERLKQLIKSSATPPQLATVLYDVALQNGSGAFVQPTTDTITRGAALANGEPLAELTDPNAPADAYPLTWISNIEVQSSGLSIDATSSIATLVRYAVTVGQGAAAGLGEGTLPAPLVAKALTAANAVVAGNCVGSDRKVVQAADGGPFWPTGVAAPTGGAFVCVSTAVAGAAVDPGTVRSAGVTTPTTVPAPQPTLPRVNASSPTLSSPYLPPTSSSEPTSGDDTTAGRDVPSTSARPTDSGSATLAAASLPLPLPGDGRHSLDRFTTMLLGGVAFLLARAVFRRRSGAST